MDITEQKEREQALQRANERLGLALDRLSGFLYEYDARTGHTSRSEGFARTLGYHPAEVPAHDGWWLEQIHPDDHAAAVELGLAAFAGDAAGFSQEYRVRHKDGHYRIVWDRGVIERDGQGQVVRVLGTTIDITERRQADAERAAMLGRERQARLETEAALQQAQEATRERDLLISIAAHDLRTPLTAVLGQAELLRRRLARDSDDERNQRTAGVIVEQAHRLNRMIGALLDLSRIQEGRLIIAPEPVQFVELLAKAVDEVQSTTSNHQIQLQAPASAVTVLGDSLRLEQVFHNLLGNAVKYSPEGGAITVWVEQDAAQVRVSVRDEGIGIPAEALPRLFTRFYRAPNATEQTTSSLGIGLFIVRELVQAHGGTISVESVEGQGSTFTIYLPLLDERVNAGSA